jgi:hypothetical protein
MICLAFPVRTPAYRGDQNWTPPYHKKLAWRLKKVGQWAFDVLIGCHHKRVTLPYQDRQTCLDCGSWRHYVPNSSLSKPDEPMFIGRWKKADLPASTSLWESKPENVLEFPASVSHCMECQWSIKGLCAVPNAALCDLESGKAVQA